MTAVFLIALAVPLVACADGGRDVADRSAQEAVMSASQSPDTLTVSGTQPRDSLRIARGAAAEADVLLFTVADVVNPDRRGVDIAVALQDPDRTSEPVPLGHVALFPVDRGGTFSLRLTPAALELVRTTEDSLHMLVTLGRDPDATGSDRRSLRITNVRWSRTAGE